MISKKSVTYRFLCVRWVLINMPPRNRVFAIYTKLRWVGKRINRRTPQPKANPTQEKLG